MGWFLSLPISAMKWCKVADWLKVTCSHIQAYADFQVWCWDEHFFCVTSAGSLKGFGFIE